MYWGIGCCKFFVVLVCLVLGIGKLIINGKEGEIYL